MTSTQSLLCEFKAKVHCTQYEVWLGFPMKVWFFSSVYSIHSLRVLSAAQSEWIFFANAHIIFQWTLIHCAPLLLFIKKYSYCGWCSVRLPIPIKRENIIPFSHFPSEYSVGFVRMTSWKALFRQLMYINIILIRCSVSRLFKLTFIHIKILTMDYSVETNEKNLFERSNVLKSEKQFKNI